MIIDFLERLGIKLEVEPGSPAAAPPENWLCASPEDVAHPWPGNVEIACHDCGDPIIDRETTPRECRKLCVRCYYDRARGSRA